MYIATKEEVVDGPDGCSCTCTCHCTCSLDPVSMATVRDDGCVIGGVMGYTITRG